MNNQEICLLGEQTVMNTYGRTPFALVKGEGSFVWDADGKKYLDLVVGIAVNNIGHCHPRVVDVLRQQAGQLLHCSNLYWIEPQVKLAQLICEHSCGEKVFFCNSGAEANEAAIKLARKWSQDKFGSGRYEIITAYHSFHGRTLGALTATGQEKYQKGFEPLIEGFKYVPFNDLEALKGAIGDKTCAIMLEPVQGEGGVYPATLEYLQGVRQLCDEKGLLFILDEVQTGLGRTGKLFGYEHYNITPDVFTLAKGLGGGVPIGAMIARGEAAKVFKPGDHASTFGGNPLAASAAYAALSVILDEKLSKQAVEKGAYIKEKFIGMQKNHPAIINIRGLGLMVGIELSLEGKPIQDECLAQGLIVNFVHNTVLRLIPALNIAYSEIDSALEIIEGALAKAEESSHNA